MYNRTYGLQKNPFNMTPDPAFLFLTTQHREALAGLTYAILQRKGFIVLTGEAGTGKTTLLARVLQFVPPSRLQFSLILNPTLTPAEFLEMALLDFGVAEVPSSKAQRLWKLQTLLLDGRRNGKISVLIVDEAHKLTPETLEEIRLLSNYEEADQKLLQIVLVGQSELDQNLNREDLRQLKQRIALRLSIGPLIPGEVGSYIAHRWTVAGGSDLPFCPQALDSIAQASRGIPRVINSLCDNALTLAFAEGDHQVGIAHVQTAVKDLRLSALPVHMAYRMPAPLARAETAVPAREKNGDGPGTEHSIWSRWSGRLGFSRDGTKS